MAIHVRITSRRSRLSRVSIAHVLQQYTGVPLPRAREWTEQILSGEALRLELDDEYAAHDLASVLSDLGADAEVEAS